MQTRVIDDRTDAAASHAVVVDHPDAPLTSTTDETTAEVAPTLRISLVIPTLNEAKNLPHVFAGLPDDIYEVILVDGFSTDDTVAVARALYPTIRVVEQTRRGKGNACPAVSLPVPAT